MEAERDDNHVPGKLGILCTDGVTTIPIRINPVNSGVMVDEVSTISYVPTAVDPQDENFVDVMLAVGNDGLFYPVNVNANGAVLIED